MLNIFDVHPDSNKRFPAHGWLENTTGGRELFLPIMELYQHGSKYHKYLQDNRKSGVWLQTHTPLKTLKNLIVCCNDIHKEVREITPLLGVPFGDDKDMASYTRVREGQARLEVLLIAAFTLLRRVGDELMVASRPFLFTHWKNGPVNMKTAIDHAERDILDNLKPICDADILKDALLNSTTWFKNLREDNGIRDIIIHQPHMLQVGGQGCGLSKDTITWHVSAHLIRFKHPEYRAIIDDLFKHLIECTDGVCDFMERLCNSVELTGEYGRNNIVFITGKDNDIVGLWPPINGAREEFPIME